MNGVTKYLTAKFYPIKVHICLHFIFKVILWTISAIFIQIWDHFIKTVFPTQFLLFSFPSSRISRWRHKLENVKKSIGPPFTWWNEAWFTWFQNFWGTFLLAFEENSREGGGLPDFKDDEEHFLFLIWHFSSKYLRG